jgi:thiol:disulfide interchange protein DsbA
LALKRFGVKSKRWPTALLALIGIAVTVAYMICEDSCAYLRGDILGMDLKYLGIFYMAAILILSLLRQSRLCLLLLAFGAGGELFLIGYQIRSGIFCPFCMAFAATVLLAFAVNYDRSRKGLAALAAGAGLLFFLLFFSGSATPAYAAALPSTTFGTGAVEVRIYTDYFCGPCRAEEAEVMALLTDLVDRKIVRVTFIDTPVHKETVLYAGYFLAALNAKKSPDFRQVVALRKALFEAAGEKFLEKEPLELFLKKKGIAFQPFDTAPVYKIYSNYIKEDKINATPSCVIITAQGKQTLVGRDDTVSALRGLRK